MAMRETLEGFQGGINIGGRRISNLRYADDIVLLAESVIDLQRLINRLDKVSRKFGLLINIDKTKVMGLNVISGYKRNSWNKLMHLCILDL